MLWHNKTALQVLCSGSYLQKNGQAEVQERLAIYQVWRSCVMSTPHYFMHFSASTVFTINWKRVKQCTSRVTETANATILQSHDNKGDATNTCQLILWQGVLCLQRCCVCKGLVCAEVLCLQRSCVCRCLVFAEVLVLQSCLHSAPLWPSLSHDLSPDCCHSRACCAFRCGST